MSIKSKLLKPVVLATLKAQILGDEFEIKRLSVARLNRYNKSIVAAQNGDTTIDVNGESAALILDSIVDEKGVPASESVSVDEFLEAHTAKALQAAVNKIINLNFMGEKAEVEAKND